MCEFCSWIEKGTGEKKKILFLTATQIFETKKGKTLFKAFTADDLTGHGAIRRYCGLEQDEGKNKECTDFSSPANFPVAIARGLIAGDFKHAPVPRGLLTKTLDDKYWADRKPLDDKYWDLFAIPENRTPTWQ